MAILVTCATESEGLLALDLRRRLPDCRLQWVADGLVRVEADLSFAEIAGRIAGDADHGSMFARHIAPVQATLPRDAAPSHVTEAVQAACAQIPPDALWNIHVRMCAMRNEIEAAAEIAAGAERRSRSNPDMILSVVHADAFYVGVAHASQCLSTWPGGERRFRKEDARISRSEFKLLEALEVFGMALPQTGMALDLGAAPGGWSRILLEHGLDVTAVDPAGLDRRLQDHPRLRHVPTTAERFLDDAPTCAIIVNDMRMSAEPSARVMAAYAARLERGGMGILTLKLPERGVISRGVLDLADRCLAILEVAYARVRARQLFHNRSEITVVMEGPA